MHTYIAARIYQHSRLAGLSACSRDTYSSFQIHSPTLIQPEVFPRAVSDQVTTPAVSKLVCNHVNVFTVLSKSVFSILIARAASIPLR